MLPRIPALQTAGIMCASGIQDACNFGMCLLPYFRLWQRRIQANSRWLGQQAQPSAAPASLGLLAWILRSHSRAAAHTCPCEVFEPSMARPALLAGWWGK